MLATTKQSGSAVGTQPLIQEILAVCLGDLALLVVTLGSGSGPPTQKLWTQTAAPATTLSLQFFYYCRSGDGMHYLISLHD